MTPAPSPRWRLAFSCPPWVSMDFRPWITVSAQKRATRWVCPEIDWYGVPGNPLPRVLYFLGQAPSWHCNPVRESGKINEHKCNIDEAAEAWVTSAFQEKAAMGYKWNYPTFSCMKSSTCSVIALIDEILWHLTLTFCGSGDAGHRHLNGPWPTTVPHEIQAEALKLCIFLWQHNKSKKVESYETWR